MFGGRALFFLDGGRGLWGRAVGRVTRRTSSEQKRRVSSRRPTEDIDRAVAAEVKARKESDARMTALLTEREASAAAE